MKASASATTTTAISSAIVVFYCANQRSAPVSAMLRMRRLPAQSQSHRPQPARAQCLPPVRAGKHSSRTTTALSACSTRLARLPANAAHHNF